MADLTKLDAANAAIQKDPKAAASTKAFAAASTSATHAINDEVKALQTTPVPQPPTQTKFLTGTHWPDPNEYATLKANGYDFAITNVGPTDQAGAKERLDAADAAGIKLIIGLYAFGGPEPYTITPTGTSWTFSAAAQQTIAYLKTRSSSILAFFGMNEPYWTSYDGHTDECGVFSAAQLRAFRTQMQGMWPDVKVYHDIGWPSEWAPGGDLANAHSCIGSKYADQTGVADYVGIWAYPFNNGGYDKAENLARFQKESAFVVSKMKALPCLLGQTFSQASAGSTMPTAAQLLDWHCAMRSTTPPGGIVSWYVWKQAGLYDDYLVNHKELWPNTNPGVACP